MFDRAGAAAPSELPSRGTDSRFSYAASRLAEADAPAPVQKLEAVRSVVLSDLAAVDQPIAPPAAPAEPMGSSFALASNGRSRGERQSEAKVPVLGQEPRLGLFFKQNADTASHAVEGEDSRKERGARLPPA